MQPPARTKAIRHIIIASPAAEDCMRLLQERMGEEVASWPWVRWVQLGADYRPGSVDWASEVAALFTLDVLRQAEQSDVELVSSAFRATVLMHLADGQRVDPFILGHHMLEQANASTASVATTLVLLAPHPYEGDADSKLVTSAIQRACHVGAAGEGLPGSPFWRIFYVGISNEAGVRFSPAQRNALAAELVRLLILDAAGDFWTWLRASDPDIGTVASAGMVRFTSGGDRALDGVRALVIRHLLEALEPFEAPPRITLGRAEAAGLADELYEASVAGDEEDALWERARAWVSRMLREAASAPADRPLALADLQQTIDGMARGIEAAWARAQADLQQVQFDMAVAQVAPPAPPPPPPPREEPPGCLGLLLGLFGAQRHRQERPQAPVAQPPASTDDSRTARLHDLRRRERALSRAVRRLSNLAQRMDQTADRLDKLAEELRRIRDEATSAVSAGPADELSIDLSTSGGVELLYRLITPPPRQRVERFSSEWLWRLAFEPAAEVMHSFAEECMRNDERPSAELDIVPLMRDRLESSALMWTEWQQVALPPCPLEALPPQAQATAVLGSTDAIRQIADAYDVDWIVLDRMEDNEVVLVRLYSGLSKDGLLQASERGEE